jgi:hypothetical protein
MLADVEKYYQDIATAEKEYEEACAEADAAYEAREETRRASVRKLDRAKRGNTTLAESTDPLVKWIAVHVLREYPEHSEAVLKALPATREQLDQLAAKMQWCGEWERLVRRAEQAGVLPAESDRTDEYNAIIRYVRDNFGAETTRTMKGQLAAAVAAEVTAAMAARDAEQPTPAE